MAKKSVPRKEDGLYNEAPYRPVLILIALSTLITGVGVYFAMINQATVWLNITVFLNGVADLSSLSIMYELVVELTYGDVGEATSGGFFNTAMHLSQFFLILAVTPILDYKSEHAVLVTMCVLLSVIVVGLGLSMGSPIEYKRTKRINAMLMVKEERT